MAVRVVTDSVSDLPPEIAEELGITVVPANVHFGTQVFRDGVDLTTDEFFEKLFSGPDFPTTSQPSVGEFLDAYTRVAEDADAIVSIHVSSKVSGTFNSAVQGAEGAEVGCPIEVIDTLQASMGVGLIVMAAARAANAGASLEEVVEVVNGETPRAQCVVLLDTLEYLKRGGRIGNAQALVGTLLKIKPLITIQDGVVDNFGKERTRRKGMARLERAAKDFSPFTAASVMYSTSRDEADSLAESIRPLMEGDEEPIVVRFGPALGTYVGPDSLGLVVLRADT